MKEVKYTCDRCKNPIDRKYQKGTPVEGGGFMFSAGGAELCTLEYKGIMGHNKFPNDGFHYHYDCFCEVVDLLTKQN